MAGELDLEVEIYCCQRNGMDSNKTFNTRSNRLYHIP
jgi:hypothetical protein